MTSEKNTEAGLTACGITRDGSPRRWLSVLRSSAAPHLGSGEYPIASLEEEGVRSDSRLGRSIYEPQRSQQVLESLCALQATGTAYDPVTHEQLGPVQLRDDGTLLVPMAVGRRRLLVQIASYHAAYRLLWEPAIGFVSSSMEVFADRVQRRSGVSARVKLRYAGESGSSAIVEGTVVDVSSGGLAFLIEQQLSAPTRGQRLHGCVVTWKGGSTLCLDAEVAQVRCHGSLVRVGVRLNAPDEWIELVEELQFSETVRGGVEPERVWAAYVASGYLNISGKRAASFDAERPAFRETQQLLEKAPGVGALFSGGRRTNPEAYIHQIQAWPGSWINIHLCRLSAGRTLRTSDDGILLRLYEHCYGFVVARPEARWFVTYTHSQDTAYSHRLHCEYARDLTGEEGCVVPFEAVEVSGVSTNAIDENIGRATSSEMRVLRQAFGRQLPVPYLKAMALAERDLGVAALARVWRGSELDRGREVLVARRGGRVVAGAVLDFSSRGIHVYGLLDKVRLVEIDPVGRHDFDALLRAAHQRYLARGISKFVYFRDLQAPTVGDGVVSSSLGNAHVNVIAREQLGGFLEHVFLSLSRTLNHFRSESRSYSVVPTRPAPARNLNGKSRNGVEESRV